MPGVELSPENLPPATRSRRFPERSRGPRLSPRSRSRPRRRTFARTSAAWPYPRPPSRRRRRRPPAAPARPVPFRSAPPCRVAPRRRTGRSASAAPPSTLPFPLSSVFSSRRLSFTLVLSSLCPFFLYSLPLFPLSFLSPSSFSFLSPSLFFPFSRLFSSSFLPSFSSFLPHYPLPLFSPTPLIPHPQSRGTRAHRCR